ncbi:chorismate mutase [Halonatronum saccharophilum]|uniref:chorismate mutase n=1 Tax=Halonatronum saccharophilum TaxID=150060 RepID=UPI0004889E36|nr:chorismate mutase [Halonatronum saccharophilum]
MVRGIRGAVTVKSNDEKEILSATKVLLEKMIRANDLKEERIASIFFSTTSDLTKAFPAVAAREIGWISVPLFCTKELDIEGSLEKCIRILIHYNTKKSLEEIEHIYLREAKSLRPDLIKEGEEE